jgi:gluconokinase
MNPYFIGIDIGTSSTKAVAFSSKGHFLAKKTASYRTLSPENGWQEQDPERVFKAALSALRELVKAMDASPGSVAMSSAMHSLMAVDEKGNPLTSLLLWSDNRSENMAARLKGTSAGQQIYRHTGTPVHPMSPLPKIAWLRENKPDTFKEAFKFIDIKTYMIYRLFGDFLTDYSMASSTGLFDAHTLKWFDPSLDFAGISVDKLPQTVSPFFILNNLDKGFARYLGLSPETSFVMGASDGCLANLGAGALAPGEAVLSIGTSGALRLTTNRPVHDEQERIFNYLLWDGVGRDKPTFVTGGASNNGAIVYDWFTRQFYGKSAGAKGMEPHRKAMDSIPAGSEGLLFIPYLYGERAPVWNSNAGGVFFGAYSRHTKAHFHKAVLEGILLNLSLIGQVLEETVAPIDSIFANGGFTKLESWVQMTADIFGKEVRIFENEDAPALGAVITGLKATGRDYSFIDHLKLEPPIRVFRPNEENFDLYRRKLTYFKEIYQQIKGLFSSSSKL